MVNHSFVATVVISAGLSSVATGLGAWAFVNSSGCDDRRVTLQTTSPPLSEEEQRKQVENFFRSSKQYDTRGGQEMRPRW